MRRSPRPRPVRNPGLCLLIALLACALAPGLLPHAAAQDTPASPPATGAAEAARAPLPELAESGQFARLLQQLRQDYADAPPLGVDTLIHDLERYQVNATQRQQQQHDAYEEALVKVETEMAQDDLEASLVAAIEAHGLADNGDDVLEHEQVVALVARAQEAATQAELAHDWVHALSLYQLLDLLYDDHATFHEQAKAARQRVRVLQLYAPNAVEALYQAQRERTRDAEDEAAEDGVTPGPGTLNGGEDAADDAADPQDADPLNVGDSEPPRIDRETWQTRLEGVELSMLQATLRHAAHGHINGEGYNHLLLGATDALLLLVRTDAIKETFPAFNDADDVAELRTYLENLRTALQNAEQDHGFFEAARIIDRILFVNSQTLNLPTPVLVYEMTEGMTQVLDDFSSVIWPQERSALERSTEGRFYGIGVQISRRDGQLVVVSPLPNTPAQRAGIRAGDVIAEVEGVSTATWSLDRAVREITGPKDTPVTVGIQRSGEAEVIQHRIVRAEIDIASVQGWSMLEDGSWDYMIDPDSRIGYIRLSQFIPKTAEDMDKAVNAMEADGQPLRGLILDLRFNPGGLLPSAVDVADRFIEEGPIVFTVDGNGDRTNEPERRAKPQNTYRPFPVVVLINEGSASASEIVSGALQDYDRALIVGSRSFGKGSVQNVYRIDQGNAYLKLTIEHYMLPGGRIIHRLPNAAQWGVEPDLVVEMTNQQVADALELRREADVLRSPDDADFADRPRADDLLTQGLDPQLEAALLVLKTRVAAQTIAMANQRPETTTSTAESR